MAHTKLKGKVYRPPLWKRMLAIFALIAIPIEAVYLWHDFLPQDESFVAIGLTTVFLAVLVVIIGWYAFEYAFRTCLIVSDTSIEVRGVYTGFITWDVVENFAWQGALKNRIWGVETSTPVQHRRNFWRNTTHNNFIPLSHIIGRPPYQKIEMLVMGIGVNLDKFAETPLGQDLLYYAPHLFEEKEKR